MGTDGNTRRWPKGKKWDTAWRNREPWVRYFTQTIRHAIQLFDATWWAYGYEFSDSEEEIRERINSVRYGI